MILRTGTAVPGRATSLPPGSVGAFQSPLARTGGQTCVRVP